MSTTSKTASSRLAFIDWTRGLAAVIMLQGHVFHSLTRRDLHDSGPYVLSQFVGGMPPAIFLFLLGVTLAFLMDSREKKGDTAGRRVTAALRRAGYLILIAFAFRLQLWAFALPHQPWTDLFRVDILNAMALAVAAFSPMAVFRTEDRVRLCAVLGVAVAAVSPLVAQFDLSGVHPFVRGYLVPDPLFFGFFPWAAFVAFGLSAGSALRLLKAEHYDRAMQWACLLGLGLIVGGRYFSSLPYSLYSKSDFWLDGPGLTFIKLGVILLILSFAFLWTRYGVGQRWSWIRQFGMTSLLVYWVHVELVYGFWLWKWKENLTVAESAVAAVAVILLMLALSLVRTNWNRWWTMRTGWLWYWRIERRYSGD